MTHIDLENRGYKVWENITDAKIIRDYVLGGELYRVVYFRRTTATKVFYGGPAPRSVL